MNDRVRIGKLLLQTGLLSQDQLNRALAIQQAESALAPAAGPSAASAPRPRRLGEIVVAEGMVNEAKVTQIVSQQLSVPWVSLEYIDFSRQLLNLVECETAEKHTLVPIYVRRAKSRGKTLYVAMEDPSDLGALEEVSEYSGLPVRAMIAPPSDIRAAILAYYLGGEAAGRLVPASRPPLSSRPTVPPHSQEPVSVEPDSMHLEGPESAPLAPILDEEAEPPLQSRDSAMPEPQKETGGRPAMVTLTLLDGTQVRLPTTQSKATKSAPEGLTARDLIEALRAESGGADMSEVLGKELSWQRLFAALLSLLLKKHLVHDWEFVRELNALHPERNVEGD